MKTNRVIIAGSRTVDSTDENLLLKIDNLLVNVDKNDLEIVSGTCKGGDILGENWAKRNNIPIKRFPANWKEHGRSAGMIRNRQMAEYGTHLIAFSMNNSSGTKNMIFEAEKRNLNIRIIKL